MRPAGSAFAVVDLLSNRSVLTPATPGHQIASTTFRSDNWIYYSVAVANQDKFSVKPTYTTYVVAEELTEDQAVPDAAWSYSFSPPAPAKPPARRGGV